MAKGDAAAMFESFSIQKFADKFDFVAYTDRLQAMELDRSLLPATSPMYKQLNEALRASLLAGQVRTAIFSMISSQAENVQNGGGVIRADRAKATEFVTSLDVKTLSSLKAAKVVEIPGKNSAIYVKNQKNEVIQAKITGADEQREYLVLYKLGTKMFKGGVTAQRYGSTWTIVTLTAPLSGMPANGAVEETSLADFDKAAGKFG